MIVAAVPITQQGSRPAARSAAIIASSIAEVDPVAGIDRHLAQRAAAEPEQLDGLLDAAVHFRRCVPGRACRESLHALSSQVDPRGRVAGDRETDEVRHRCSAHQQPAGRRRQADDLLAPVDDLGLDVVPDVVAATHVRVEHRGEEIAERAERGTRAHVPRPEPRMRVAHAERGYRLAKLLVDGSGILRRHRQRRMETRDDLLGQRLPDRACTHGGEVVDRVVDRTMGQRAKRVPVRRVQAAGRRRVVHAAILARQDDSRLRLSARPSPPAARPSFPA